MTTTTTANIEEIKKNIQAVEEAEKSKATRKPEFTEAEIEANKAKTRYISKDFWDF